MTITAAPDVIQAVWDALAGETCRAHPAAIIAARARKIVAKGWSGYDTEELFIEIGLPPSLRHWLKPEHFGVPIRTAFLCPRPTSRQAVGGDHAAAADLFAMVLDLERLGFAIDPAPLVDALRPRLLRRAVLTDSELRILWYRRERNRMDPLDLAAPGCRAFFLDRPVRLPTGFRAIPEYQDGSAVALRVVPPGRRSHRPASELPRVARPSAKAAHA